MGYKKESIVDYWLTDDGLMLISSWTRDGVMLSELARRIGVSYNVLKAWRDEYPEIREAVGTSRELIDYKVENALLKRALGFTSKEIKVTLGKKIVNGETFQVLKETTTKEVAPDVSACMAWLNNRKFDKWKRNRDKVVELDAEDNNVVITINRGNPDKDGLGGNVNQQVEFRKEAGKEAPNDPKEKDPVKEGQDEWPEDWEEEG